MSFVSYSCFLCLVFFLGNHQGKHLHARSLYCRDLDMWVCYRTQLLIGGDPVASFSIVTLQMNHYLIITSDATVRWDESEIASKCKTSYIREKATSAECAVLGISGLADWLAGRQAGSEEHISQRHNPFYRLQHNCGASETGNKQPISSL